MEHTRVRATAARGERSIPSRGGMTSVMRAASVPAARPVVRLGLLRDGRVVDERAIEDPRQATVGSTEAAMFIVPGPALPVSFRLFATIDGALHLRLLPSMRGVVASDEHDSERLELPPRAEAAPSSIRLVRLGPLARGKIVVADVTILFQLVPHPPRARQPRLPLAMLDGCSHRIDWTMTVIVAFSFLAHFGTIGTLYSDWTDPVVDEQLTVAGIVERLSVPLPPPLESAPGPTDREPSRLDSSRPTQAPKTPGRVPTHSSRASPSAPDRPNATLARELERAGMEVLGVLNAPGPAVQNVLKRGDVPTAALDDIARRDVGVDPRGGQLAMSSGSPIRPGAPRSFAELGDTRRGTSGNAGTSAATAGPAVTVTPGAPEARFGAVSDADRVVAAMRGGFRACYTRGLASNGDIEGTVRIVTKIGANGEVTSATPSGGGSLGPEVVACIVRRVEIATFAPPQGGNATLVIPVTLKRQ